MLLYHNSKIFDFFYLLGFFPAGLTESLIDEIWNCIVEEGILDSESEVSEFSDTSSEEAPASQSTEKEKFEWR